MTRVWKPVPLPDYHVLYFPSLFFSFSFSFSFSFFFFFFFCREICTSPPSSSPRWKKESLNYNVSAGSRRVLFAASRYGWKKTATAALLVGTTVARSSGYNVPYETVNSSSSSKSLYDRVFGNELISFINPRIHRLFLESALNGLGFIIETINAKSLNRWAE